MMIVYLPDWTRLIRSVLSKAEPVDGKWNKFCILLSNLVKNEASGLMTLDKLKDQNSSRCSLRMEALHNKPHPSCSAVDR